MNLDLTKYQSEQELNKLKAVVSDARQWFAERLPRERDHQFGVSANTLRAFRGVNKPSIVFRTWAGRRMDAPEFLEQSRAASSQQAFAELHRMLTSSLTTWWEQETSKELTIAHKYKLVDLFIKDACRLDLNAPAVNQNFITYGHVPIDSRVLNALDSLLSGVLLSSGQSMGGIKTEKAYRFYQEVIGLLMNQIGSPRLYFDYFAWNLKRASNRVSLELIPTLKATE